MDGKQKAIKKVQDELMGNRLLNQSKAQGVGNRLSDENWGLSFCPVAHPTVAECYHI